MRESTARFEYTVCIWGILDENFEKGCKHAYVRCGVCKSVLFACHYKLGKQGCHYDVVDAFDKMLCIYDEVPLSFVYLI